MPAEEKAAEKPQTKRLKFEEQVQVSAWAVQEATRLRSEMDGAADAFGWSEAARKFQRKALAALIQAEG